MQLRLPGWSGPRASPSPSRPRAVEIEGRMFPLKVARHRGARRYVLRVTDEGVLRVTVPRGASIAGAVTFARRESAWVAREWARLSARVAWGDGARVWYRGELVVLRQADETLQCGADVIPWRPPEPVRAAMHAHWRAQATAELPPRCLDLARRHGLAPASVRVRDQRSRWGACSGSGAITLNWRLVQMPPDVSDYVILHELAHLRQPNHSRRFWREVEALCPEWRAAERWLKAFGRDLL
jgi:predicted metal-dependent hydrolase